MARRLNHTTALSTRERLMRLAARAFGAQGYTATSMRKIADMAGLEAASIYYHFASKEALVDAVMEHGAERIVRHIYRRIDTLPANASAEDRFRAALTGQLTGLVKYGDYAFARGRLHEQLPEKVQQRQVSRREKHQAFWDGLLQGLRDEGYLRDDVNLALCRVFILGAINSATGWFDPAKGPADAVVDEFCAVFFDGVRRH